MGSALGVVTADGMAVRPVSGCSLDFDGAVSVHVLSSELGVVP